jgi:hypothetical protein
MQTESDRILGELVDRGDLVANTYYRIDPTSRVAGVFATQVLSFFDRRALDACLALERRVYATL